MESGTKGLKGNSFFSWHLFVVEFFYHEHVLLLCQQVSFIFILCIKASKRRAWRESERQKIEAQPSILLRDENREDNKTVRISDWAWNSAAFTTGRIATRIPPWAASGSFLTWFRRFIDVVHNIKCQKCADKFNKAPNSTETRETCVAHSNKPWKWKETEGGQRRNETGWWLSRLFRVKELRDRT